MLESDDGFLAPRIPSVGHNGSSGIALGVELDKGKGVHPVHTDVGPVQVQKNDIDLVGIELCAVGLNRRDAA